MTSIANTILGVDGTTYENDKQTLALKSSGVTTSTVFSFGEVQSRIEILLHAETDIVVAATKTITVDLLEDIADDGSFTKVTTIEVLPEGTYSDIFLKYVSTDDTLLYGKIRITTTENQSAESVILDFKRIV